MLLYNATLCYYIVLNLILKLMHRVTILYIYIKIIDSENNCFYHVRKKRNCTKLLDKIIRIH